MASLSEKLFYAARDGDLAGLQACLAAGADPNEVQGRGDRVDAPLLAASWYGNVECVQALLAAGADPEISDAFGVRPLHQAALMGHAGCVEALIAGGASPSAGNVNRYTPLHAGARRDSDAALRLLLAAQPEAALCRAYDGTTALVNALQGRCLEPARCLLQHGVLPPVSEVLALLGKCEGNWAQPLYAALAVRQPLSAAEWALVPTPCAGLGAALPAVLQRSTAEAALLVRRLPAVNRQRMHTCALCLARAQHDHGMHLPLLALGRMLSLAAAD